MKYLRIKTCRVLSYSDKTNACLLSCVPQAILSYEGKDILSQVAKAVKAVHEMSSSHGIPPLLVLVEGHTNCRDPAKRSNSYHMRLSEARADACREYLEGAGGSAFKLNRYPGVKISDSWPLLTAPTSIGRPHMMHDQMACRHGMLLCLSK